jgi:acyl dehydratase
VDVYREVADLEGALGRDLGPTEWMTIDQARVDKFAESTEDRQWIHVDAERAATGPFKGTVAHGYLTVALIPHFVNSLRRHENLEMSLNYGLNKVRFPTAVPVGRRVRARTTLVDLEKLGDRGAQVVLRTTVEIEGVDKPACVAETVSRYYFR